MRRRNWPVALAILFVAQLAWFLVYTESIVKSFRSNAETLSRIYAQVQEGVSDPGAGAAEESLYSLQGIILESGVPLVLTSSGDSVIAAANLPFEADLTIPEGQQRALAFARRLDLRHPPIGDSAITLLHFGDPPEVRSLRWVPWLQAGGLLLTVALGALAIRAQRRAEGEKAWTAMARELAHQLGTPISSLQGWTELLKLPPSERPEALGEREIAGEIDADLGRLGRISHRFELIGRAPELKELDLEEVLASLRHYLEVRLPRLASGVTLQVDVDPHLPPVLGNAVLLTWALENVVKNSLDALGGRGGTIRIRAEVGGKDQVHIAVMDSGPGVPLELRGKIFEAGVTSKPRGWGVGLALARRIVEGVHRGRLELGSDEGTGATFHFFLPASPQKRSRGV